jgi:hypothetical protein
MEAPLNPILFACQPAYFLLSTDAGCQVGHVGREPYQLRANDTPILPHADTSPSSPRRAVFFCYQLSLYDLSTNVRVREAV